MIIPKIYNICKGDDRVEKVETITCAEAAQMIHKNAEFIRAGLRQNKFDFGVAVEGKNGQFNYLIFKDKFLRFIGKEVQTDEKTTNETN